jgi:hypothetical protein
MLSTLTVLPTRCPECGRDAPVVYRGVMPTCTACGAIRLPLSGASLNLAGKPSKVGGVLTGVLGWLVLLFGLSVALALGLLSLAIWTVGVGLAVALPLVLLTLGLGLPLVLGGKAMRRSGTDAEREMREQAFLSMLSERGRVSAAQAAGALGMRVEDADALLTSLAKSQPDRVTVDVDEDGTVWYGGAAVSAPASPWVAAPRVRVGAPAQPAVEVEAEVVEVDSTGRAGGKTAP